MTVHDSSGPPIARTAAILSASVLILCCLGSTSFPLDSASGLQRHDVTFEALSYQDRKAIRVVPPAPAGSELAGAKNAEGGRTVVFQGSSFHNGAIESGSQVSSGG